MVVPSGAAAASSAFMAMGRMTAWGQTMAHRLHWAHLVPSHWGTVMAMPRFSKAAEPAGYTPSARSAKADTGRSSPCRRPTGSRISLTNFFISGRSVGTSSRRGASSAVFQLSGTSTFTISWAPRSMPAKLAFTTASPFLENFLTTAAFISSIAFSTGKIPEMAKNADCKMVEARPGKPTSSAI